MKIKSTYPDGSPRTYDVHHIVGDYGVAVDTEGLREVFMLCSVVGIIIGVIVVVALVAILIWRGG
jgi:hypothetical protein